MRSICRSETFFISRFRFLCSSAIMWSAVFFFSFICVVSAAPLSKFYSFLPHHTSHLPSKPSNQAANDKPLPSYLQGLITPISMEIFLPQRLRETAAGAGTNSMFPGLPAHLQPGVNAPISIEIFPPGFHGTAAGGQGSETGFIKYSIPKAPGRKSVEIFYPYNFDKVEMLPNLMQQIPNMFPFNYPPQTGPQPHLPRVTF
ncbi:secretory calcium-binding phosphoprotein 5 [Tachysurus fulvidraco]|uniref:secretory calcium-binding phosphoprotein 5 n=1 Tax=Tachysurus fulvidraco TaxID=1234273 RepID=UPI001FEE92EE|nr:secretory calcium-binding phosphoprotein 5 [Tachysurus fulvidraco]